MIVQAKISAKAETPDMRSDAIVVSFDYIWYEPLRRRGFSAIIRKRVPTTFQPSWLYFHINSPKSAICARAPLAGIDHLDLKSVIKIEKSIGISRVAITDYFGHADSVGVYLLGTIELAQVEAAISKLSASLIYSPPQSFFVLSRPAKEIIDTICRFQAVHSNHRSEKRA